MSFNDLATLKNAHQIEGELTTARLNMILHQDFQTFSQTSALYPQTNSRAIQHRYDIKS